MLSRIHLDAQSILRSIVGKYLQRGFHLNDLWHLRISTTEFKHKATMYNATAYNETATKYFSVAFTWMITLEASKLIQTTLHRTTNGMKRRYSQAAFLSIWRAHALNAGIFILRSKFDLQQLFYTKFSGFLLFLCLVLEDPMAPCYCKHVCVCNSGFSRIVSPTTRDNFRAMFVWFLYPEKTWRR